MGGNHSAIRIEDTEKAGMRQDEGRSATPAKSDELQAVRGRHLELWESKGSDGWRERGGYGEEAEVDTERSGGGVRRNVHRTKRRCFGTSSTALVSIVSSPTPTLRSNPFLFPHRPQDGMWREGTNKAVPFERLARMLEIASAETSSSSSSSSSLSSSPCRAHEREIESERLAPYTRA